MRSFSQDRRDLIKASSACEAFECLLRTTLIDPHRRLHAGPRWVELAALIVSIRAFANRIIFVTAVMTTQGTNCVICTRAFDYVPVPVVLSCCAPRSKCA